MTPLSSLAPADIDALLDCLQRKGLISRFIRSSPPPLPGLETCSGMISGYDILPRPLPDVPTPPAIEAIALDIEKLSLSDLLALTRKLEREWQVEATPRPPPIIPGPG